MSDKTPLPTAHPVNLAGARPTDITNPELWHFPMEYPLRIIGESSAALRTEVEQILTSQFADFNVERIAERPSRTGKYLSLHTVLELKSVQEVNELYAALAASPLIKTVL